MTLASTLTPATKPHANASAVSNAQRVANAPRIANAHESPAEHLARLLDAIVLDGNVRAMEAVASVLARAGSRMQSVADEALAGSGTVRLPVAGSASFRMAERIARRALAGTLDRAANGADRFHMLGERPEWARTAQPVAEAGVFVFYRAASKGVPATANSC